MQEILALETARIKAMCDLDIDRLEEILSDDLVYTHSTARQETKAEFIAALSSGRTKYQSINREDVKVQEYGETAVVTGHAKFHVNANGNDVRFQVKFTDVYVKREEKWQMVAWQSTKIPD